MKDFIYKVINKALPALCILLAFSVLVLYGFVVYYILAAIGKIFIEIINTIFV